MNDSRFKARLVHVAPTLLVAAAVFGASCASAPTQRWYSGICNASVALEAGPRSTVDITPLAQSGRLVNAEFSATEGEHRFGFGCNHIPPSVRGRFTGPGLSENASADLRKKGFKSARDETRRVRELDERRLTLAKDGERDVHLLYRWPEDRAFLNRAFVFPGGEKGHRDVGDYFDAFREGMGDYEPWQPLGLGECEARYAFPTRPDCTYVIGFDHVIVSCTAKVKDAPETRVVAKCMLQKSSADKDEGTALALLDRGLQLARSTTTGISTLSTQLLTETGRSNPSDVWTRARRHTLRSDDGARQREALVAIHGVVIHALWVETDGGEAPSPALVTRFFKTFSR